MRSKQSNQGELIIDHRNSPGIDPAWAAANGVTGPVVAGGKTYETGIKNCGHCGGHVIMHPQRTREREWCGRCDAYICDGCGFRKKQGASCQPLRATLDDLFNATQRSF